MRILMLICLLFTVQKSVFAFRGQDGGGGGDTVTNKAESSKNSHCRQLVEILTNQSILINQGVRNKTITSSTSSFLVKGLKNMFADFETTCVTQKKSKPYSYSYIIDSIEEAVLKNQLTRSEADSLVSNLEVIESIAN